MMNREDHQKRYVWSVEDLFTSKDEVEIELSKIETITLAIEANKNSFTLDCNKLFNVLDQMHLVFQKLETVYVYYKCILDQDHRLDQSLQDINKIQAIYVDVSSRLSFIDPEILKLSESTILNYIKESKDLAKYKRYLEVLMLQKPHLLSAEAEEIISKSGLLSQVPYDLFMTMTNSDMKFEDVKDQTGAVHSVNENTYFTLLSSHDRELRKNAFNSLINGYKAFENTIGNIYVSQLKANSFNTNVRGFNDPLDRALKPNEINTEIYHNLITAVNKNVEINHKYIELRSKILKLNDLDYYDMYVPLISIEDSKFEYEKGCKLVLESLECLGQEYVNTVKDVINNRWIDVYPNTGKYSGAYSSGTYLTKPYILLNYTDTLNDVFTLTHELGHSMQSYMTNQSQPYQQSDYKIFIAEIASTVNELLLFEHLYENSDDSDFLAYVLNYNLEQFRTTVFRQTMFAEFELFANDGYFNSQPMSPKILSDKYFELNLKYFGENLVKNQLISYEWLRIPHFYMNFYVYQYATCFCVAVEIVKKLKSNDKEMLERYHEFLKAGNSKDPVTIIADLGIDMTKPDVFDNALGVYKNNIERLEKLLKEKNE